MKYIVKIEKEIKETEEQQKYPSHETVYEQVIEGDEKTVLEIIKATNGIF